MKTPIDYTKYVVRILSESKKRPHKRGYRRVMALVHIFGVNCTRHIDVPQNFQV